MGWGSLARLAAAGVVVVTAAGCAVMHRSHSGRCQDTTVTLYFETGSDQVSPIGREIIAATASRLRPCPVGDLRLLGLADPVGAAQSNLELSKRRAENVRAAFDHTGLPYDHFTLVAAGDRGAERPNGEIEPVRRRVDVTVMMRR